jgi:hypothetical protein
MFSTACEEPGSKVADNVFFIPMACGVDSSMNSGSNETYPLSTGPTTTATLLYL